MSRSFSFIALLLVMAAGMYIYTKQLKSVSPGEGAAANPKATIDLQGVRSDLLQFARAEQQHLATDGHYLTLDELRSGGDTGLPRDSRANFGYSIEVGNGTFTVTATYTGPPGEGVPKAMRIGPEMTISTE